jgi:anaerobic magnesium-protoporphyrin IX monomethyl ester cyclase
MNKVILFNPRATEHHARIPNSVLAIAASIEGKYDYVIVDGNLESDPMKLIGTYLQTGEFRYFASTVMPGPQLKQAIPFSKTIRETFPEVKIIWGGYFPSNHSKVVLESGFVDIIVNGPGDKCFPRIVDAFEKGQSFQGINNILYLQDGKIIKSPKDELYDLDQLAPYPYEKLNSFYPIEKYQQKTCIGLRPVSYHSSFGCPFTCSFCAVVPIYNARWKGSSAAHIAADVRYLKTRFGADSVEFMDNNFFVSEKRTIEFCKLIAPEKMYWWGEGRIDTIDKYKDETLVLMKEAGCKMIFFGAESGDDEVLKKMDKGGTQSSTQILKFAKRMKDVGIIPEYSFVLGTPADTPEKAMAQIDKDIAFIRKVKEINPDTEIIIYIYSPVPTEGSEMFNKVLGTGFRYPQKLEEWILPEWENFDLRKNPLTPWLSAEMIDKIKNFETVLHGYYPAVSDLRLTPIKRRLMKRISSFRYKRGLYPFPYEIKALQKFWKYRKPEIEGF